MEEPNFVPKCEPKYEESESDVIVIDNSDVENDPFWQG